MKLEELHNLVGKYVKFDGEDPIIASGWCVSVEPIREFGEGDGKFPGRYLNLDWGMSVLVSDDCTIAEVDPPADDTGPFNPWDFDPPEGS